MNDPVTTDPSDAGRSLKLAISSARALAILYLAFGGIGFLISPVPPQPTAIIQTLQPSLVLLGLGGVYVVLVICIKQRRAWAVIAALVVTSLQMLFIARMMLDAGNFAGFLLIILAPLIALTLHLVRALRGLRRGDVAQARGFEVLPAVPITPGPPVPPAPAIPVHSPPPPADH